MLHSRKHDAALKVLTKNVFPKGNASGYRTQQVVEISPENF